MFEQALAQMGEVAIRVIGRGDTFVHLKDVDLVPRNVLVDSARNIIQGVWPPLTAMTNRPRTATEARASAAMMAAASRATASASASTSIFMKPSSILIHRSRPDYASRREVGLSLLRRFFVVPAELIAQGREQFILEIRLAS